LKKLLCLIFIATGSSTAFAAPRTVPEAVLQASIRVCSGQPKVTRRPIDAPLPAAFSGEYVFVESDEPTCGGQYAAIVASDGSYYIGAPWILKGTPEGTPAEKIRSFAWDRMQEVFETEVAATPSKNGLLHVTVLQKTESGKVPIEGWVDRKGKVFFLGDFHPGSANLPKTRLTELEPILAESPTLGSPSAPVTIVEFSDFECPSCKSAGRYVKPMLEKYGDKVRYIRVDFPLVSVHPWAFAAALAGRAIYRQSPDAFWKYKELIYDAQSELSIFTLEDLAKNFVKDHDLDPKRYEADVNDPKLKDSLLSSVGKGFALQVMATPSYLVNGVFVDTGKDGATLDHYVAGLLGTPTAK
jgi:protein-disulfide isomerase